MRNITLSLLLAFFSGIAGACLIMMLTYNPRIATVNITSLVTHFAKSEVEKKHSPEELKRRSHIFGKTLEKTIKEIARKDRLIILPAEAVMEGAIDITEKVQQTFRPS